MTKDEALKLIQEGKVKLWNRYREIDPDWKPDLSGLDLSQSNLVPKGKPFDFSNANLFGTKLPAKREWMIVRDVLGEKVLRKVGFIKVNLKDAVFDIHTKYPENLDLKSLGAVLITESQKKTLKTDTINVFISYTWTDDGPVLAIDQWLRDKHIQTKLDKRDFFAGSRIRDEIFRVMAECNVILIFRSQRSKDKPWPQFETELTADLEMEAKGKGVVPPRILYVVIDDTPLPTISDKNKIAIMAKGKRFELVCEEIYHSILQVPRSADKVDLKKWSEYVF